MRLAVNDGGISAFVVRYGEVGVRRVRMDLATLHGLLGCDCVAAVPAHVGDLRFTVLAGRDVDTHGRPSVLGVDVRGPALVFATEGDLLRDLTLWESSVLWGSLEMVSYAFADGTVTDTIALRMTPSPTDPEGCDAMERARGEVRG